MKRWREVVGVETQIESDELETKGDRRLEGLMREIELLQGQYEEQMTVSMELKQTAMEGLEIAEVHLVLMFRLSGN